MYSANPKFTSDFINFQSMIRTYRGAWVPDSITLFNGFMKSLIYAKLGGGNLISYLFTNESASDIRFEQKIDLFFIQI